MKLPRYQQQGTGIGRASRSLTAGVQTSSIGKQLTKGLSNVADQFLDYNLKMRLAERDAKVKLKTAEAGSQITNKILEFKDPRNPNYLNPSSWENDYDTYAEKIQEQYKTEFGDDYKYIAPSLISKLTDGRIKIKETVFNQILKNQKTAAETTTNTYLTEMDNYRRPQEFLSNWTVFQANMEDFKAKGLYGDAEFTKLVQSSKDTTNLKYLQFQTAQSKTITVGGQEEIDWGNALKNATNTKFKLLDIEGNELSPDDTLRSGIIKHLTEKNDAQKQRITGITTQQDLQGSLKFSDQLLAIQSQTPEGIVYMKTFLDELKQSNVSGKLKRTLATAFNTIIKNTKNKADTPEGRAMQTVLTLMVGTKYIDTRSEMNIIHEARANSLIDDDQYKDLLTRSRKNMETATKGDQKAYRRFVSLISKTIGKPNIAETVNKFLSFENEDVALGDIVASLDRRYDPETYDAIMYLDQLLTEGEQKGFSIKELLGRGPNSISKDYLEYAKQVKAKDKIKDIAFTFGPLQIDEQATYQYEGLADIFLNNKTPLWNVPKRKTDETLEEWQKRIKIPQELSVDTGYNRIDRFHESQLIIPIFE